MNGKRERYKVSAPVASHDAAAGAQAVRRQRSAEVVYEKTALISAGFRFAELFLFFVRLVRL